MTYVAGISKPAILIPRISLTKLLDTNNNVTAIANAETIVKAASFASMA